MNNTKRIWLTGFALFSLFFGAGNLIFPPYLGRISGNFWQWVTLGFITSAVVLPLLGIMAHARLQGTMMDFGKKVGRSFSLVYCVLVYAISLALPAPRTASVTHEMAVQPFVSDNYLLTSTIFFALVLVFALNRSKVLDIIGKFLSPLIGIILLLVIVLGVVHFDAMVPQELEKPFVKGLVEGYQTFDTIGAVVVGGVVIISLNLKGITSFQEKKKLISQAGLIAGSGLLLIYVGLIYLGAHFESSPTVTRTALLSNIFIATLGNIGNAFLSVLVALACFTTAVGIITGAADFMKGLLGDSTQVYTLTVVMGCLLGVFMGQFDVHYIVDVAVPALMFIYPITIVLILLNLLPTSWASAKVFKAAVVSTMLFSVPDFLSTVGFTNEMAAVKDYIPLGHYSMGWLLPTFLVVLLVNASLRMKATPAPN